MLSATGGDATGPHGMVEILFLGFAVLASLTLRSPLQSLLSVDLKFAQRGCR